MIHREADGTTWWNGRRMFWFAGAELHCDADVYAASRGISRERAEIELAEMLSDLLPGKPIKVV